MNFSEQFKEARKARGLTQQQLADKTGIPFRTIQNWEGGKSTPQDWCQRLLLAELERMKKG